MRRLLLALAFIAVAISGCMEKAPSSEEIMTKMDNSMANLSAYNYEISYEQTTSIKDLAKDNVTGEHNTTSFSLK